MSLYIRYFGDSVLRQKGHKIEKFDDHLSKLSQDMLEIMHASDFYEFFLRYTHTKCPPEENFSYL